MKIEPTQIIRTSPGRNFISVKVFTDEGLYGLGDVKHALDFGAATGSAS